MAEYIRESALQSEVVQPCTEADIKEYRTLVGMANNLNQLTKMAHQDGIIYLYTWLERTNKAPTRRKDDRENHEGSIV